MRNINRLKDLEKILAAVLLTIIILISMVGIISTESVFAAMGEGRITADTLNVRNSPSKEGEAIGSVKGNEIYTILGETDGWYEIEYNGTTGYIYSEYVELQEPEEIIEEEESQAEEDNAPMEEEEEEKAESPGIFSGARAFIIMGLAVIVVILSIIMTIKSINSGEAYEDFDDIEAYDDYDSYEDSYDYEGDYEEYYDEYEEDYEDYQEPSRESYVRPQEERQAVQPTAQRTRVPQGEFKLKNEAKRTEINREQDDLAGYTLDIDPSIFDE